MALTKPDARQIVLRAAQAMIGSAAGATLDTVFPLINNELAKLFEDRNVLLVGNGDLTFSGSVLSLASSGTIKLHVNSKVAGGSPVLISLLANPSTVTLADGDMWYVVIDRVAGTATSSTGSSLPAVTSSNQEVFLIAKRVDDTTNSTARLYFRNGFTMNAGDTSKLSASGGSSFDVNKILVDVSGNVVTSGGYVLLSL